MVRRGKRNQRRGDFLEPHWRQQLDQWLPLAHWFRGRYRALVQKVKVWRGWDDEDITGTLLLAQVKAHQLWRPERGTWSTFATVVMVRALLAAASVKRLVPTISGGSLDALADERDVYREVHAAWDREEVARWLLTLEPKRRRVIEGRFGFGGEDQTLLAIGARLGVTKQRVSELERTALTKLRPLVVARLG